MTDIRVGTKVTLLQTKYRDIKGHYTKVEIPVEYEVVDIFLEAYTLGYKVVVKAKYYRPDCDCSFMKTFFLNDFLEKISNVQFAELKGGKEE